MEKVASLLFLLKNAQLDAHSVCIFRVYLYSLWLLQLAYPLCDLVPYE